MEFSPIIITLIVITINLMLIFNDCWNHLSSRITFEPDGSFLFDEWYVKTENQERYLRQFIDDPIFRRYVKEDKTETFYKYLYERAIDRTNMVNIFTGQPGTGKSDVARAIMQKTLKLRIEILNEYKKHYFEFKPGSFKAKLSEMDEGDFVQCDEWANMEGENSRALLAEIDNLLATMRMTRKCVNLCTPMGVVLMGTTSVFEPFGFNKDYVFKYRSLVLTKFHDFKETNKWLDYEFNWILSKKMYDQIVNQRSKLQEEKNLDPDQIEKELRKIFLDPNEMKTRCLWSTFDPKSQKATFQGIIILNIGLELQKDDGYDEAKRLNYENLEENEGSVGANTDSRLLRIERIAQELYDYSHENFGYPDNSENPAKGILSLYLSKMSKEKKKDYGLTTKDKKDLENEVVLIAKRESKKMETKFEIKQKEELAFKWGSGEFEINESKLLEQIQIQYGNRKGSKMERNIEIWNLLKNPTTTYEDIVKAYPELNNRQSVDYVVNQIKGYLSNLKGGLYEEYIKPYFETIFEQVIHGGDHGEFDFMCVKKQNVFYISVKCYDFGSNSLEITHDEHKAEIVAARRYYKVYSTIPRVIVHLFNMYNKKVYTYEIPQDLIINSYPISKNMKTIIHLELFDIKDVLKELVEI